MYRRLQGFVLLSVPSGAHAGAAHAGAAAHAGSAAHAGAAARYK